jgi:hypothetical protein
MQITPEKLKQNLIDYKKNQETVFENAKHKLLNFVLAVMDESSKLGHDKIYYHQFLNIYAYEKMGISSEEFHLLKEQRTMDFILDELTKLGFSVDKLAKKIYFN